MKMEKNKSLQDNCISGYSYFKNMVRVVTVRILLYLQNNNKRFWLFVLVNKIKEIKKIIIRVRDLRKKLNKNNNL